MLTDCCIVDKELRETLLIDSIYDIEREIIISIYVYIFIHVYIYISLEDL